eukprot:13006526-Alexandrium_andersonii.AAC.1
MPSQHVEVRMSAVPVLLSELTKPLGPPSSREATAFNRTSPSSATVGPIPSSTGLRSKHGRPTARPPPRMVVLYVFGPLVMEELPSVSASLQDLNALAASLARPGIS